MDMHYNNLIIAALSSSQRDVCVVGAVCAVVGYRVSTAAREVLQHPDDAARVLPQPPQRLHASGARARLKRAQGEQAN